MQPHEQRVVDECTELEDKCEKLGAFLETPFFNTLPDDDQELLAKQSIVMQSYLHILECRIERFKPTS